MNWQTTAGILVTVILVTALAVGAPNQNPVLWLGLSMIVGFSVALSISALQIAQPMRKPFFRMTLRTIRTLRRLHAVSAAVRLLHASAWSIGTLSVAATFSGHDRIAQACMTVFFGLMFVAGVCELIERGAWLRRQIWIEMAGKVFSVTVGAILLYLSIAKAKTWVHSITHIDPKYLTESTAILSAILLPLMYGLVVVALLYFLAILQMMGLALFSIATMFAQQFAPFAGASNYARIELLWYRLATGKKPPQNVLPKSSLLSGISIFSRPVSTIAIILAVSAASQTVSETMPPFLPHLKSILVALEYRKGSSCLGFENDIPVVYMEDGNISVVRAVGNDLKFSVETCTFKPAVKDS